MKTGTIMGVVTVGVISMAGCSTESVLELEPGTCFNVSYDATEISRVPTVSCAEEHDAEVFHLFEITENMTYDDEAVFTLAFEQCVEAFEGYVGVDFYDEQVFHLDIYTMYPVANGWKDGDRGVVCSVVSIDPTNKLTGTQRNAFAPN
jgi:hypothetical protein